MSALIALIILIVLAAIVLILFEKKHRQLSQSSGAEAEVLEYPRESGASRFNLQHYLLCCRVTLLVYSKYGESLSSPVSIEVSEVEYPRYLFSADYGLFDMYKTQTITGVIGKVKGQNLGIISFRGTSSWQEWLSDAASQFQVPIRYVSEFNPLNPEEVLGLPLSSRVLARQLSRGEEIGEGWYNLYCRALEPQTKSGCICDSLCSGTCRVLQKGSYSMIGRECPSSTTDECSSSVVRESLALQVLRGVRHLKRRGINRFIITGHSLGAALAYICAYHIALEFGGEAVQSVYAFASPKVGSREFAGRLADLLGNSKLNNVLNTNDVVGYVPLGGNFFAAGDGSRTFTYTQSGWGAADYHSLDRDYMSRGSNALFGRSS